MHWHAPVGSTASSALAATAGLFLRPQRTEIGTAVGLRQQRAFKRFSKRSRAVTAGRRLWRVAGPNHNPRHLGQTHYS